MQHKVENIVIKLTVTRMQSKMAPFQVQSEYKASDADIYFVKALQLLASWPTVGRVVHLSGED